MGWDGMGWDGMGWDGMGWISGWGEVKSAFNNIVLISLEQPHVSFPFSLFWLVAECKIVSRYDLNSQTGPKLSQHAQCLN